MKSGFGWDLGPFEVIDAIGFKYFVDRCQVENIKLPEWMILMRKNNHDYIYKYTNGEKTVFDKKKLIIQ